jgi:hypothetical protein
MVQDEADKTLSSKKCLGCGAEAVYRCPGCGVESCSVACVRKHKEETQCDGKRSQATYIPLSQFTDQQLLSGVSESA